MLKSPHVVLAVSLVLGTTSMTCADWTPTQTQEVWKELGTLSLPGGSLSQVLAIDGDRALIRGAEEGDIWTTAYICERQENGAWEIQANFTDGGFGTRFASAGALDGDTVIIGAPDYGDSVNGGKSYIYERDQATGTWELATTIIGGVEGDLFGYSVDLDGDHAIIGAPEANNNRGYTRFMHRGLDGTWLSIAQWQGFLTDDRFGYVVSVDEDLCAIGTPNSSDHDGDVEVFEYNGTNWETTPLISGSGDPKYFGRHLDLDGDRMLITATGAADQFGAAYIYERNAKGDWSEVAAFRSQQSQQWFGLLAELDGDRALTATQDNENFTAESILLYERNENGIWRLAEVIEGMVASPYTRSAVALDGNRIMYPRQEQAPLWNQTVRVLELTEKSLDGCAADINGDGNVDGADMGLLLGAWGLCP